MLVFKCWKAMVNWTVVVYTYREQLIVHERYAVSFLSMSSYDGTVLPTCTFTLSERVILQTDIALFPKCVSDSRVYVNTSESKKRCEMWSRFNILHSFLFLINLTSHGDLPLYLNLPWCLFSFTLKCFKYFQSVVGS